MRSKTGKRGVRGVSGVSGGSGVRGVRGASGVSGVSGVSGLRGATESHNSGISHLSILGSLSFSIMKNPVRGLRALGGRTLRGLLSPGSAHVAAGLPNPPTPSRRVGRFQRNVSLDMVFRVYGGAGAGH
jgi:hypothetical protein